MKSLVRLGGAVLLALIASAVTTTGANAQQRALTVKIPFDFTLGDTRMPAGQYKITSDGAFLVLRSTGHSAEVLSLENHSESKSGSELVFDQYGDQYFLHEVRNPYVSSLSRSVAPSKAEKVAREHAIEAHLPNTGEQTIVAVR